MYEWHDKNISTCIFYASFPVTGHPIDGSPKVFGKALGCILIARVFI